MTDAPRRRRLIVNLATPSLDEFRTVAAAAAERLTDHWDVRFIVSHLAGKDRTLRTDPGDPYLEYAANFPDLFHFAVPQAVQPEIDSGRTMPHFKLAAAKVAILREAGLRPAFLGREPALLPAALLERLPHWRGPRVDHPRRSRNPVFAPCFHQPEVQAAYREAFTALHARLPELDTFFWWTNDSGSGFCWYPYAYAGPNGPSACRADGPIPAMAAFHACVLEAASAAGASAPLSVMTQTRIWDAERLPAGAYRYPAPEGRPGAASIRADASLTYPVRAPWDPFGRVRQVAAILAQRPVAVMWWLSDVYHRTSIDAPSAVEQIRLLADLSARPERAAHVASRVALVRDLATTSHGAAAADHVVDGWAGLADAFAKQIAPPFRTPLIEFLPTYGTVSHRWLTRPLVAFPAELSAEEESWFLPHVFAVGDAARRENLLDVNGYPAAAPGEPPDLRSAFFTSIAADLEAAAAAFSRVADDPQLRARATAARLLACIWTTIRNWIEFGALLARGVEGATPPADQAALESAEAFRRRLFAVLRDELDNSQRFLDLLGDDPAGVLVRGTDPADEDPFTLGPDVARQIGRKRAVMLAHWQDVARLVPRSDG